VTLNLLNSSYELLSKANLARVKSPDQGVICEEMAAEVQVWVEGGEVGKKLASQKEPLVEVVEPSNTSSSSSGASSSATTNGSAGTGESALSVISDTMSEEYSSDSGKGGSDTTVTPPDSINGTEAMVAQLQVQYGSYTAYSKSMGTVMPHQPMIYEFEIPQLIVGRLIGRFGAYVNKIKHASGATIFIKRHPSSDRNKICAVEGVAHEIEAAVKMIRQRFPLKGYPNLTMEQINSQELVPTPNISFIPNNRIHLIEGVINDVSVSCVMDLDHIFLQQPTHPTFPVLARLHEALKALYEQPNGAPQLVRPFNPGVICVTKIGSSDWVRAEVVIIHEEKDLVTAKLVDVGGYVQVPIDVLRQIRVDFVTIPFQATECRLANIAPVNEKEGWSEEAVNFFRIICQGQVLQAHVVGYCNRDGTTLINLYKPNGNANHILINDQMVMHNYAKWVDELDQQYYYTDGVAAYSNEINQLSQNLGEWVTLSPNLLTIVPTEETANAAVPDTEDTQVTATANGTDDGNTEDSAGSPTILSWADEMTSHDLEEKKLEDLTVKGEDENARRKSN